MQRRGPRGLQRNTPREVVDGPDSPGRSSLSAIALVGLAVLRRGGNAVDATVATALALAVVHPEAGNLGGGGFAVIRLPEGTVVALDFRETAPGAASPDMYAGKGANASAGGALSSGVPGSVAGLWALHARFGALSWGELVGPAEKLAREGFAVDQGFVDALTRGHEHLGKDAVGLMPSWTPAIRTATPSRWSRIIS